jgi:quinol-cytochrome oxidoreductase complex cytochrome b subunit
MFLSALAEFLYYLLDLIGSLLLSEAVGRHEENSRKWIALFWIGIVELFVVGLIGYILLPRLPIWGFLLAVTLLVFGAAIAFFATAQFMFRDERRK